MSTPVILRPEAESDVEETYAELEVLQAGLGDRFSAQLRELLDRVEDMPKMYGILKRNVRAARTRKFRYVVFYVVHTDRVEVLAVLHGSRDPAVWQSRI